MTGPPSRPVVGIVIVNWNAGDQLRECLESIAEADWSSVRLGAVVVVDNASADASLDAIGATGLPLAIVRNQENRGFAVACNQGARGIEADYVLFLNPDARLLKHSVARTVEFLEDEASSAVGIAGVQLVDADGHVARSCARFPTPWTLLTKATGLDRVPLAWLRSYAMAEWDHRSSRQVDHVIGAFYLVRRSLLAALGGFDERFFVYLEDLDFSLRANQAGWSTYYLADVRAYHRGGGTSEGAKSARLFYALRSRLLYVRKHFSWRGAAVAAVMTLCVEPVLRLLACAGSGSAAGMRETLGAYRMLWGAFLVEMTAPSPDGPRAHVD